MNSSFSIDHTRLVKHDVESGEITYGGQKLPLNFGENSVVHVTQVTEWFLEIRCDKERYIVDCLATYGTTSRVVHKTDLSVEVLQKIEKIRAEVGLDCRGYITLSEEPQVYKRKGKEWELPEGQKKDALFVKWKEGVLYFLGGNEKPFFIIPNL